MIHNLATKLASLFVLYGESADDDVDIYAYGCEAIISSIVNIGVAMMISFIFGRVLEGIIFMAVFALLRRYTGGYHADTHFKCIVTFNTILVFALVLVSMESRLEPSFLNSNILTASIASISLIGIFAMAPVENENKPIDKELYPKTKRISRWMTIALWTICLINIYIIDIYIMNGNFGFIISLSMFSVFGSLAYANPHLKP